jgi:Na+/proline symporter
MILLALCGMALLTYYLDPQFQTEIAEGITDPRNAEVADKVFPHFIAHVLPVGIAGLVVSALFAVAMSSLDSGMNSVATVLTVDLFSRRNPQLSKTGELRLARKLTLIVGLSCTALAWMMSYIPQDYNIIDITARTFNCALGPLGAMFVAGMFFRHVGQRAIVSSVFCGLTIAVGCAWWTELVAVGCARWTELVWFLGLSDYPPLIAAQVHVSGPSPFLVTPIAATSTLLIAGLLGVLIPSRNPDRAKLFSWRTIVFGGRKT